MDTNVFSKAEIARRVARFADLKPADDFAAGATDGISESARKAALSQTVYGLTSPTGAAVRNFWDNGAVSAGTPNFGAVYVTSAPGQGASWHIHRYSYENFIALKGTWRIFWNAPPSEEHVDLAPHDMVSIPPGAIRRFEYVGGEEEGLMMAFAYAAEHALTTPLEVVVPPCELERLDRLAEAGGPDAKLYADRVRSLTEEADATETDADRRFTAEVKAFIVGDAVRA